MRNEGEAFRKLWLTFGTVCFHHFQFIRYLIGRDFPGQRIGPEPTTDRFVAVMDGPEER